MNKFNNLINYVGGAVQNAASAVQNVAANNVPTMVSADPLVGKVFSIGHRNIRIDSKI